MDNKVTQVEINGNTILVVDDLPENAHSFAFGFDSPNWLYFYHKDYHNSFDHRHIVLPPGQYELLGRAGELNPLQIGTLLNKTKDIGKHWAAYCKVHSIDEKSLLILKCK